MRVAELAVRVREGGARRLAVVAAHDAEVLGAVARAAADGICQPVLLGVRGRIEQILAAEGLALPEAEIIDIDDDKEAAARALAMVRGHEVHGLMKGKISTPDLMRIGLREGLRRDAADAMLSHVAIFEHERYGRMIMMTDGGLIPYPTFEQRVQIVKNGVEAMRRLGIAEPRVACLSSTEEVSEKIPCSVDAARLTEMNRPGGPLADCGHIDGPLDLGAALDAETARIKQRSGEVAGQADILHVPDVAAGNLLGKAIMYFSSARMGGCIVGGTVPIALLSRASTAEEKYLSILLALSC